jgi:hypothetical protein
MQPGPYRKRCKEPASGPGQCAVPVMMTTAYGTPTGTRDCSPLGSPTPCGSAHWQGAAAALLALRTRPLPQPTASSLVVESFLFDGSTDRRVFKPVPRQPIHGR